MIEKKEKFMAKKKTVTANDKKLKSLEKKLYFICYKNDLDDENESDCIEGANLFIATEECLEEHISKYAKDRADDQGYDLDDLSFVVFEAKKVGDVSVSSNPVVKLSK